MDKEEFDDLLSDYKYQVYEDGDKELKEFIKELSKDFEEELKKYYMKKRAIDKENSKKIRDFHKEHGFIQKENYWDN